METIQVVLDGKLLKAADIAAKRQKVNRSALIRMWTNLRNATGEVIKLSPNSRKSIVRGRRLPLGQKTEPWRCLSLPIRAAGQAEAGSHPHSRERNWPSFDRTVAPITSTVRDVPSEVILDMDDGMKGRCAINLHNAVTVSQVRLARRVVSLSEERMREVCAALRFSLGCG